MDSGSGGGDAVVAGGGVGLHGFAEMEEAVGEGHVGERSPDGIGGICGGLHHDGDVRRAGDVESELIVPHAKVAVGGLDERVPENSRDTWICVRPACGAGQIIADRRG